MAEPAAARQAPVRSAQADDGGAIRLEAAAVRRGGRHAATAADANLVEGLLDVVSRARLEQAPAPPLSDLGRMVWWVEHATVRATTKPPEDLPLPSKKRADMTSRGPHILTV